MNEHLIYNTGLFFHLLYILLILWQIVDGTETLHCAEKCNKRIINYCLMVDVGEEDLESDKLT